MGDLGGFPLSNAQPENSSKTPVVMMIDQFEECFTMSQPDQRLEFFNGLIELIENTNNLIVLIAMRSDFRGRLRDYTEFVEKINRPYINVEHLNRQEIEEAMQRGLGGSPHSRFASRSDRTTGGISRIRD
ncbi:hypothetical protein [Moorena sp. SIO4G3]|uniref:nSTAND1 domain-containing NTPase n=1 Tax=Moorena sp. SIO4G3 TaxID=2607821 RepID=UPI0025FF094B|nr:hypothetical protein [Moorena sp. SIO4G3]